MIFELSLLAFLSCEFKNQKSKIKMRKAHNSKLKIQNSKLKMRTTQNSKFKIAPTAHNSKLKL